MQREDEFQDLVAEIRHLEMHDKEVVHESFRHQGIVTPKGTDKSLLGGSTDKSLLGDDAEEEEEDVHRTQSESDSTKALSDFKKLNVIVASTSILGAVPEKVASVAKLVKRDSELETRSILLDPDVLGCTAFWVIWFTIVATLLFLKLSVVEVVEVVDAVTPPLLP